MLHMNFMLLLYLETTVFSLIWVSISFCFISSDIFEGQMYFEYNPYKHVRN